MVLLPPLVSDQVWLISSDLSYRHADIELAVLAVLVPDMHGQVARLVTFLGAVRALEHRFLPALKPAVQIQPALVDVGLVTVRAAPGRVHHADMPSTPSLWTALFPLSPTVPAPQTVSQRQHCLYVVAVGYNRRERSVIVVRYGLVWNGNSCSDRVGRVALGLMAEWRMETYTFWQFDIPSFTTSHFLANLKEGQTHNVMHQPVENKIIKSKLSPVFWVTDFQI